MKYKIIAQILYIIFLAPCFNETFETLWRSTSLFNYIISDLNMKIKLVTPKIGSSHAELASMVAKYVFAMNLNQYDEFNILLLLFLIIEHLNLH
jgi:hypothetical protein